MSAPCEVRAVEHLGGHQLGLAFAHGPSGDVGPTDRFAGPVGAMFAPLREVADCAQVVEEELGTVVWPNGAI